MNNIIKLLADNINYIIFTFFIVESIIFVYLLRLTIKFNYRIDSKIKKVAEECKYIGDINSSEAILIWFNNYLDSLKKEEAFEVKGYFKAENEGRDEIDTSYLEYIKNIFKTIIETFTLLGILGTVCAISASLSSNVNDIEQLLKEFGFFFGQAVNSTIYGLICAIIFMIINSILETRIDRILSNRLLYLNLFERAIRSISLLINKDNNHNNSGK